MYVNAVNPTTKTLSLQQNWSFYQPPKDTLCVHTTFVQDGHPVTNWFSVSHPTICLNHKSTHLPSDIY